MDIVNIFICKGKVIYSRLKLQLQQLKYLDVSLVCQTCFSLTVGVQITTDPQDELVNVSDSVNFTCEASGSTPISYRWLYNGNDITDDPGHIEGANTNTLMIVNVEVTDWGVYSCVASNIVDNATSNEATLHGEYLSVCLYMCVCMCMCVYMRLCMYLCVYISLV